MDSNNISLLALIVTIIGWLYTAFQQKRILEMQIKADKEKEHRNELQEKLSKVYALLADYAKLSQLYRFRSQFSANLVVDDNGNPIPESPEKFKIDEKYFVTNEKMDEAFKQMKGFDIISLLNQTKATILINSEEVNDILAELDPTNHLNEQLKKLYFRTIYQYDILIENPQNWSMLHTPVNVFNLITEQTQIRRELRNEIDIIVRRKFNL